jgi:hypothetical protein
MTFVAILAVVAAVVFYILMNQKAGKLRETETLVKDQQQRVTSLAKQITDEIGKAQRLEQDMESLRKRVVPEAEAKAAWAAFEKEKTDIAQRLASLRAVSEQERSGAEKQLAEMRASTNREIQGLMAQVNRAKEEVELQELGFRRRSFTYEDPKSYQDAISALEDRMAAALKSGQAAKCNINWSIEGSQKQGEAMIKKLLKIAIRAFNADADAAIARVKWNNLKTMEDRIRKSEETIEKNLDKWGIVIVDSYRDMKIKELNLTYEQAEVEQRVKEEQRDMKEQMREEERARREAERARIEAEQEERKLQQAIAKAKQEMEMSHTADMTKHLMKIKELEIKLAQAGDARIRAVSMAQLTKMGHVYIISNIGSFGEGVFKIGMTRRLDPMDRVWELSDASVPFDFDVHALIRCDDAPALESKLHQTFAERRLNLVNERKEFFRVAVHEIQQVVSQQGLDVKLTELAEAREHKESLGMRTAVKG